jgi:EAL domain-containing protein (putative c-di-GMP-specific phosphodiesterase class I)
VSVHLSIGLTDSRRSRNAAQLLRDADLAMYQAKAEGKGRFAVFEPPLAAAILRRHDLKEDLARAIEREEIVVEYQPIVSLATGRISAAEALVRWEHPARGSIPPSEFVPLAEDTGMIGELGSHVLRQACRQARSWEVAAPGEDPLGVHVNVSVAELRDADIVGKVLTELSKTGLEPQHLVLEITESQLLGNTVESAARFAELRAHGVRVSLDDFGTGYSSLSYLHSLPLDSLKIAKPFVDRLTGNGRDASFIRLIIDLARTLELQVIAEGIESQDQLDMLRALGTELGQGFLLGRPGPPASGRFART